MMMTAAYEEDVYEDVAQWYLRLDAPGVSEADRTAFTAWLAVSEARQRVHAEMAGALELLTAAALTPATFETQLAPLLNVSGGEDNVVMLAPRRRMWRTAMAAAAALALILGIGFQTLRTDAPEFTHIATPVGGTMTVKLDDGTTVYLNTDTRLAYALEAGERNVLLERGEAFFEVAKDPARPFVVNAGAHAITVVGTAFDVKFVREEANLVVTEGVTRVSHTATSALANRQVREVRAGMSARMSSDGSVSVTSARSLDAVGSWRTGRLIYRDRPIAEIIADLDRYMGSALVLANPARGNDQFTVVLQIDSEPAMLKRMAQLLPVTLKEIRPGVYEVKVQ